MSHPHRLIPGLVALAWLSLAVPALAGPRGVPIKGTLQTHVTLAPPTDPLPLLGEGTGNVSHLGRTEAELNFAIDTAVPRAPFSGTITFTAANGDTLYATFSGDYPDGPPSFTGEIIFTGGTGRFTGASGSATLTGEDASVIDPFDFTVSFDGTISY